MIGRENRVLLRHYLEQGMTKAAIARHVGVSRDTIYRWIATGQLDRDLDDEAVRYRSRAPVPSKLDPYKAILDVRLAEYPKLTATRLFKEVQDAGYPGSYSQVKRYVRRVRPRPPEEPVQRFETPPGYQGKVERPIRYIRESFFYGRDFVSDDDLNARALEWLDRDANVRIHGTLKERPADRFERERPHLTPLTPWPYRSVAPQPDPQGATRTRAAALPPVVDVEQRPLAAYARITGDVQ